MTTQKFRFDNMDAAESAFFSRELEHIRARALETQFAELDAKSFVPPIGESIHPGARVYTYRQFTSVGYAAWAADYSKGPRVDLFGEEASSYIRGMKVAYGYNVDEMRAAQMQGLGLDQRKANSARRAIAQLQDQAIWTGDGPSLLGLLNQSNTTSFTVPAGVSTSKAWTAKTPQEILDDMFGIEAAIIDGSSNIEKPDTLLLPLSRYNLIARTRLGDGSDMTVLKFFLEHSVSVKSVLRTHRLESEDAAYGKNVSSKFTGKRMVCYKRDPEKLGYIESLPFTQLAPQYDGYEVITHCEAKSGGVVSFFPKSIAYGDEI